ncbi:hypothetical protein MTO98_17680 [Mucilaginibacter sp. SMC90]|uniref:hypothetical protein n=1 Tax=Mucilaginibacter sp. SMC90 TaxID=2929803 RepID=UPI001FB2696A|nr:hypothetical protein [Mucilaginibacter sp. SMC90]UOE46233.1 hypothetical protein MTO98_17680 [Mucilaginibacter sp. SMC90]
MSELLEITDRIKSTFTREEFVAKTLLAKEGAIAKKLFYIERYKYIGRVSDQ